MLSLEDVTFSYGSGFSLGPLSFRIDRGEIAALLGPNGAGKTTLLELIAGLEDPRSGSIRLNDRELKALPVNRRARMGISYLPQEHSLFRGLSVAENFLIILEGRGLTEEKSRERTETYLERFSLKSVKHHHFDRLSAGQRRKAEIARSLVTEPKYLLLDEPFSNIDPLTIGELKDQLQALKKEGIGLTISDHRVSDVLAVSGYNYLLQEGQLLCQGTTEEIVKDKEALDNYLGEEFEL